MSLKASIYPFGNAFTRNPIFLSVETSSMATYAISGNNIKLFEGEGTGSFRVNISEVVETILSAPDISVDEKILIPVASSFANRREINVSVTNENGDRQSLSFTAWIGGISKRMFRNLHSGGTDIFASKFLNPECNFFFTTRSNNWKIALKETEIFPLMFIYQGAIEIKELITGQSISAETPLTAYMIGQPYALNIEAVRKKFLTGYNLLANLFDIYVDGKFSCRIGIEQSRITRERYLLKFLNSFGAYELFEMEGEAQTTPAISEEEDTIYNRYDEITDSFCSTRKRIEIQESVTIKTGFKRPEEIRFLLDVLSSDDVYLIGYGPDEIKVIPSAEEFTFRENPVSPQNVTLKLTFTEEESNPTPDITADGYKKPRVHSKQFSKQFN